MNEEYAFYDLDNEGNPLDTLDDVYKAFGNPFVARGYMFGDRVKATGEVLNTYLWEEESWSKILGLDKGVLITLLFSKSDYKYKVTAHRLGGTDSVEFKTSYWRNAAKVIECIMDEWGN